MTELERKQIEHLKQRKDSLIDNFIGACEEINRQIDDVRKGFWLRAVKAESEEE